MGQFTWPSGADRELRPWPSGQIRKLKLHHDIRRDLIFDGFEHVSGAPHSHDEHDVTLPSDSVQEIASATTPVVNPEHITPSESRGIDPAMETALTVVMEPDIDFTPYESRVGEPLDSPPATDSEPHTFVPTKSDWAPIMEFTLADIFQH